VPLGEKWNTFLPKLEMVNALNTSIKQSVGMFWQNRPEKEIKDLSTRKTETELSLFAHDQIIFIEIPKKSI
jgi:hypothetical protein